MFGSSGGFGSSSTPAAVGFGAPAAGAFGAPAAAGAFGAPAAAGAFGAPAAAGAFGTPAAAGAFGAPAAGGFGSPAPAFGAPALAVGFGAPATTGGFGAPAATGGFGTPAAGGFGSPSPAFAAPAASGGFGAPAAIGGFGAPAAAGGFGSPSPAFGAPAAAAGAFGSAPAFGTPAAGGGFGSPAPIGGFGAPAPGGFGSAPAFGTPAAGGFGAPAASTFSLSGQPLPGAGAAAPGGGKIAKCFEKLQQSYAPFQDASGRPATSVLVGGRLSDDCIFKTVMYDKRSGPAQAPDPALTGSQLEQAEMNNPDPDRYYPVRIVGIDALKARFDQQQTEAQQLKEHTRNLKEVIEAVELSNTQMSSRFSSLQMKQVHIYQHLLTILRKVEVLRCRGVPLEQNEIRYRARLNQILAAMKTPYLEIQELSDNLVQQEHASDVYADVPREQDLESLYDALKRQREGLEYITEILAKDVRDVHVVRSALKL